MSQSERERPAVKRNSMAAGRFVDTEWNEHVAWLTLNRPDKRNALSAEMIAELKHALREADADGAVRVLAIRGAGKDFCAGADLAGLQRIVEGSVMDNLADVDELAELFLLIRRLRKPVVAVVHGRALAGGCGLATACDLVFAAESASFGYPEVRIGFVPAMVMAILRRNVSEKRAFALITSGDAISAAEAERIGLINGVLPDEGFAEQARECITALSQRSASAVQLCKRLLYQQDAMPFDAAIRAGADLNVIARMTEDTRTGVESFLRK
jgi:methylglutaconyl-CoA hydratase